MVIFGNFGTQTLAARVQVSVQILNHEFCISQTYKHSKDKINLNLAKLIVGVTSNNQTITLTADCAPI